MPADPLERARDEAHLMADTYDRPFMVLATKRGAVVQPLAAKPGGTIVWVAFPARGGKDGE